MEHDNYSAPSDDCHDTLDDLFQEQSETLEIVSLDTPTATDPEISLPLPKRKKIVKDDSAPLPHPFPLPKYFRADVETALAKKEMTIETTRAFYSAIASAMFVYKKYPTSEDYITVGRCIIEKLLPNSTYRNSIC